MSEAGTISPAAAPPGKPPATAPTAPVDETLFFSLDPLRLAGSRCAACSTVAFPAVIFCPGCSSGDVSRAELADRGTLWSWTVQRIEPKKPYVAAADGFEPFAVGYVDLGDVLVESRLLGPVDSFRIGQELRLASLPLPPAGHENAPLFTYAFADDGSPR